MVITDAIRQHVLKISASIWIPAAKTGGEVCDGAWVAELSGNFLESWPKGIPAILCKERTYSGIQLRIINPTACGSSASPPAPATD